MIRMYSAPISLSGVAALGLVAAAMLLVASPVARAAPQDQNAPGEDVLPTEQREPRTERLPQEDALPGEAPPPQQLPDEAALPAGAAAQQADDGAASLTPGASRPWLRLNLPGHTGTVLSVAAGGDAKYLASAGEDKDVHIWTPDGPPQRPWIHRRTIRWQVERGPRGRIYTIAASPHGLAMAGHGAMGALGEIWIVDPLSGALQRALVDVDKGHRQVVAALAWAPGAAQRLASIDVEGRVMLWQPDADTGLWFGRMLVLPDPERYGKNAAIALQSRRRFIALAFAGPDHIVAARWTGVTSTDPPAPAWRLERIEVATGQSQTLPQVDHVEFVTALAASPDGSRLASADAVGNCWIWTLGNPATAQQIQVGATVLSLDFSADGKRLLIGTAAGADGVAAQVQVWSTDATPQRQTILTRSDHVRDAGWIDANRVCLTQQTRVEVVPLNAADQFDATAIQPLAAPLNTIRTVAFATELPYRVRLETTDVAGQPQEQVFDLSNVELSAGEDVDVEWRPADQGRGGWNLERVETPQQMIWHRLTFQGTPAARLPLDRTFHGSPISTAWLLDDTGQPAAVAVGTDARNSIYVFRLAREGTAPLLRQFRGHSGAVVSLSVSPDARYLVSGSTDSTVSVWKIEGVLKDPVLSNWWGLQFEEAADDAATDDGTALTVSEARSDGPLFFRGVRAGDELISVRWVQEGQTEARSTAAAMREALETVPFDSLVVFDFVRNGRAREGFQSFPAWQPVVSLYVDNQRQWALWTPAGYYDASFDGHRRFGWQLNRGVSSEPDFFTAAQFRNRLERPNVLRGLLAAGDLPAAMRAAALPGPPPGEGAILNQSELRPAIELVRPEEGATVTDGHVAVEATFEVPRGAQLVPPKVFANGVAAAKRELVGETTTEAGLQRLTYRWDAKLPPDQTIQLQVLAATDAEAVAQHTITLQQPSRPQPRRAPRMHLIAAGVNKYSDPQIQPLSLATNGVEEITNLFQTGTDGLYTFDAFQLKDGRATRTMWRLAVEETIQRIADDCLPDDLVVLYLVGHGIRDRSHNRYYYVTADARYEDVMNERYDALLSMADLAAFGQLPCRKVAILDTCHSGAVQTALRSQDLKAALRALQDDVVFTFTASEGHEEAVEDAARGLSRFTFRFAEALQGAADQSGNQDEIVTLREAIDYCMRTVTEDSRDDAFIQHPTAGPLDLLPYVTIPLTRAHQE